MCAAIASSPSDAPSASPPRCRSILESSRRWKSAIPSWPRSGRATTRLALPPSSKRTARIWFRQELFTAEDDQLVLEKQDQGEPAHAEYRRQDRSSGRDRKST